LEKHSIYLIRETPGRNVREHFVMVQSYWSLFIHETEGNLKKEKFYCWNFQAGIDTWRKHAKFFSSFISSILSFFFM